SAKEAISELRRNYGLLSNQTTDTILAGDPLVVAGLLINIGRGSGLRAGGATQILALRPGTNEVVWRQPAERFLDSVAVTRPGPPAVLYVTGNANDPTAVILNRLDVARGERTRLASWNRPSA